MELDKIEKRYAQVVRRCRAQKRSVRDLQRCLASYKHSLSKAYDDIIYWRNYSQKCDAQNRELRAHPQEQEQDSGFVTLLLGVIIGQMVSIGLVIICR